MPQQKDHAYIPVCENRVRGALEDLSNALDATQAMVLCIQGQMRPNWKDQGAFIKSAAHHVQIGNRLLRKANKHVARARRLRRHEFS